VRRRSFVSNRIPRFAICAACGAAGPLAGCHRCGILTCPACGGAERPCVACVNELAADARRRRWRTALATTAQAFGMGLAVVISAASLATFAAAGDLAGDGGCPSTLEPACRGARLDDERLPALEELDEIELTEAPGPRFFTCDGPLPLP
jgi:hypothetical protein